MLWLGSYGTLMNRIKQKCESCENVIDVELCYLWTAHNIQVGNATHSTIICPTCEERQEVEVLNE